MTELEVEVGLEEMLRELDGDSSEYDVIYHALLYLSEYRRGVSHDSHTD